MQQNDHIEINPDVMVGKPVIKGTRVTVEAIVRRVAEGQTIQEILQEYPHLKEEDVKGALRYAAALVEGEEVFPTA